MTKNINAKEIQKQMEYYLGDKNLARDEFFRDKISASKVGFVDLSLFQNCNKIKAMGITNKDIADSLKESKALEVSKDGKMVRRAEGLELPAKLAQNKKRDNKANDKAGANGTDEPKVEKEEVVEVNRDELGRIKFEAKDFDLENTIILHFITKDQDKDADDNYKVNWKDIETMVKSDYSDVKITYSRADKYEGHLAVSKYKSSKEQIEKLKVLKDQKLGKEEKKFDFSLLEGEDLKDFWQKQGGHYHYCIAPKLRLARKFSKKSQDAKREEKAKKQKRSYTIAGIYYIDINKVKSKSRAILNNMKDGEALNEADTAFMNEIIKFHARSADKLKNFASFQVGPHPEYNKTRCFFVVKTEGEKEDFSVSKCIQNLEAQSADGEDDEEEKKEEKKE